MLGNKQHAAGLSAGSSFEGKNFPKPSITHLSPSCWGGKCTSSQGLFRFPRQGRDSHPVFGQWVHYVLTKCIPGIEDSCSRFSACLCLFPKKVSFPLHGFSQVVAKGRGEKHRINMLLKDTFWSKPTVFCVNLLF